MKHNQIEIYRDDNIIKYLLKDKIVIISIKDEKLFQSYSWNLVKAKQLDEKYYLTAWYNNKNQYLHRIIMGAIKGQLVDHKNRNPLDCSRDNLRIVTSKVNSLNRTQTKNKSGTKYKGVFKNKRGGKKPYYSMIQSRIGKTIYCGSYKTEIEAANAYNLKVKELYGVDN